MQAQLSQIWYSALKLLKNAADLSATSYEHWIEPLLPVGMREQTIYLKMPTEIHYEIVKTMHLDKIRQAVESLGDYEVELLDYNDPTTFEEPSPMEQGPGDPGAASHLNPRYAFESFVVGESNQLAHAASKAVAERPAMAFNPLFIYGGAGLGKTHLVQAIGNRMKELNPNANIIYITSESFTNDFINTLMEKKNKTDFRNKYRTCDALLIDDIQFIATKDQTQVEFFHTFNALYEANKQIIMTSDRPPKEIKELEERLRTRFEWGLITDIKPPDLETRVAILKKKAEEENFEVPDNILFYIAENLKSNIRNLEGVLKRLTAYNVLMGKPITMALADDAIKEFLNKSDDPHINTEYILSIVANYFGLTPDEILSSKRTQEICYARHIAMYLMREFTDLSMPRIGKELNRTNATIIHGIENIKKCMETDEATRKIIDELTKNLENRES